MFVVLIVLIIGWPDPDNHTYTSPLHLVGIVWRVFLVVFYIFRTAVLLLLCSACNSSITKCSVLVW